MYAEVRRIDPEIYDAIRNEIRRQQTQLELIASENYVSQAVLDAAGSPLTNKYAEGLPGKRYYRGCDYVDTVERLAIDRAKLVFHAEHANVQPHSGTQANLAVYLALLSPGDKILGMDLAHGGHLSHGAKLNASGAFYQIASYGVSRETERLEMAEVARVAREVKPRIIVCGASAYSRTLDFAAFGEIAREVGAFLMADIAHIAGLVAAELHPSPFPHCDVVTATTHKTMRGPRGGLILSKEQYAKQIDRAVFPGTQGGPLMHVIAGKAVALKEVLSPGFREYQASVLANARALAAGMAKRGYRIVTGGTDNHLFLVDLRPKGITGSWAAAALEAVGITANKNLIPYDPLPPTETSGVRLGSPALTTRGMGVAEMDLIADLIDRTVTATKEKDASMLRRIAEEVLDLCDAFPIYAGLLRRLYEQERGAYETGSAHRGVVHA